MNSGNRPKLAAAIDYPLLVVIGSPGFLLPVNLIKVFRAHLSEPQPIKTNPMKIKLKILGCLLALLLGSGLAAHASVAYGSVNNFDTVNDNGVPGHGFEIELDDCRSADITYTYDYNHYGTPKFTQQISQDGLLKWHTNMFVRYQAVWTNTDWSAYTAVPAGPIPPTMGHQFTNPRTNFGGEHFGVGYRVQPSKVLYFWLIDSGTHTLSRGGQVNVSTPTFTYNPPPLPAQAAQVVAVIPAPLLPMKGEFSDATWCKEIRTTSHTNVQVGIRDLMSVDTNNPNGRDWRNGQTNVEVEVEWQLLQIDYMSADFNPTNGLGGQNAKLAAAAQALNHSDDVETRRYEYYAYVGPYDDLSEPPTHEALCQMPGADGIHGTGTYSNTVVVGKFLGAQMSGMVAAPPVGLIDHLPDGQLNAAYPTRSVVIAGDTNFIATNSGALPAGMAFDAASGQIYGTPYTAGIFIFNVNVSSSNNPVVTKAYPFMITSGVVPPHSAVDVNVSSTNGGTAIGNGVFTNGTTATVVAAPKPGFVFANWTEGGEVVSTATNYTFTNIVNQSFVANFILNPNPPLQTQRTGVGSFVLLWPTNYSGFTLQQIPSLNSTNWTVALEAISNSGPNYQATIITTNGPRYFRLRHP